MAEQERRGEGKEGRRKRWRRKREKGCIKGTNERWVVTREQAPLRQRRQLAQHLVLKSGLGNREMIQMFASKFPTQSYGNWRKRPIRLLETNLITTMRSRLQPARCLRILRDCTTRKCKRWQIASTYITEDDISAAEEHNLRNIIFESKNGKIIFHFVNK